MNAATVVPGTGGHMGRGSRPSIIRREWPRPWGASGGYEGTWPVDRRQNLDGNNPAPWQVASP